MIPAADAAQPGYSQRSGEQGAGQSGYSQGAPQYTTDPRYQSEPRYQGGPQYPQSGPPTAPPYQSGQPGGYDDPLGGRHTGMPGGGQQYPYGGDPGGQQ